MKILYVGCAFDGGKSGISVYIRETLSRLAQKNQITVLCTKSEAPLLPKHENIRLHVLPGLFSPAVMNMLYVYILLYFRFRKRDFDVLFLPAANRRAVWRKKFFTVGMVHDLSQYHIATKYDPFRMYYIRKILPGAVRKLNRVAAVSNSTAEDLEEFWRIPAEKISVVYNGFDRTAFHAEQIPLERSNQVMLRYRISGKFILYVSRIEHPGKNHLRLIQAYEQLPEQLKNQYSLVLGGSRWNGAEAVLRYAEQSADRARIHFIGFVAPEDLPILYHTASLYVFPSLFEGFGLSLPEAMACGCVVCCSTNSSLGEIAGEAALQFDPESADAIAGSMREALESEKLRSFLRQLGYERIALFDWDKHCETLLKLFQSRYLEKITLFGLCYDNVSMEQALEWIFSAVRTGTRKKAAFVNADCFNQLWNNKSYRDALEQFDWIFPDGSGIALAGKLRGTPVRDNVNGTDMLPKLAKIAEHENHSLFLYGARPGVAEQMRENLKRQYPALRIAGVCDGYFKGNVVEQINDSGADILLVALGVPLQEKWISEHFDELKCSVAVGVGGLFDFYSGRIPRAPKWLRGIGMEWIFRLAMEPRRMFRRYVIGNPLFLWRVVTSKK